MEILFKKISPKHNDPFWYDGVLARNNGYVMMAVGEIDIRAENSNFRCNGFSSWDEQNDWENNLTDPDKSNDDDLNKIGSDFGDEYRWENNNWFEILPEDNLGEFGDVYDGYDEALKALSEIK